MEVPLNGGIGYVVLFGGLEITGVLLLFAVSVPLQPAKKITLQRTVPPQRRKGAKETQRKTFAPLRLCGRTALVVTSLLRVSVLFVEIVLKSGPLILFLWQWVTRDTILTFDPATEIDKLATLRTEGTKRVVFPLDWLTAGWTFHES
jgi:hypothetical protein